MTSSEFEEPVKPKRKRKERFKKWAKDADRPTPYNPLDLENLGQSVERHLLLKDAVPLTEMPKVIGQGVYALYYDGDHELYRPIAGTETPIYVGKAVPQGGRKGTVDASKETKALFDRIEEHKESLEVANGLDVQHFSVRFLVAVEIFVPLTERVMITQLKPVWNLVVDGFGNHNPGSERRTQARPPWDELHPGRWWSHPTVMPKPSKYSAQDSADRVAAFFAGGDVDYDIDLDALADGREEESAQAKFVF